MSWVEREVVRQGEDPWPDTAVQSIRTPALEVCPAAAPDEESVPSEGPGVVGVDVGDAARSVAGGRRNQQGTTSKLDPLSVLARKYSELR